MVPLVVLSFLFVSFIIASSCFPRDFLRVDELSEKRNGAREMA